MTVPFLVAGAAAQAGKQVTMFLSKEAVRLALPSVALGIACDGRPALPPLATQYAKASGRMLVCPICFDALKLSEGELVAGAQLGGATPLWQWIDEGGHRLQLLTHSRMSTRSGLLGVAGDTEPDWT